PRNSRLPERDFRRQGRRRVGAEGQAPPPRGCCAPWTQTTDILVGVRGERAGECLPSGLTKNPSARPSVSIGNFSRRESGVGDCQILMTLVRERRKGRVSSCGTHLPLKSIKAWKCIRIICTVRSDPRASG